MGHSGIPGLRPSSSIATSISAGTLVNPLPGRLSLPVLYLLPGRDLLRPDPDLGSDGGRGTWGDVRPEMGHVIISSTD